MEDLLEARLIDRRLALLALFDAVGVDVVDHELWLGEGYLDEGVFEG